MSVFKPLIAIVGPTAVGKSGLAIELSRRFKGEIVNADSRQLYRGMDIGTAKPDKAARSHVPHHLMDVLEPDHSYSIALYQRQAYQAIDDILESGRLPFLVGGSGLYVKAVLEGLQVPAVPPDIAHRAELEAEAQHNGGQELYKRLALVDPLAAARIGPTNVRRVIRALEVHQTTGKRFSELGGKQRPAYDTLIIGLTCPRRELYRRIDLRVDDMMKKGLLDEVRLLTVHGYDKKLPAMSSLGYQQLVAYLEGACSLEEAVQQIKFATHRFARHQYAWFKPSDASIHWIDIAAIDPVETASRLVKEHLAGQSQVS